MSDIDLSRLPAPDVVESLNYETILAERKQRFISLHPAAEQAAIAELLELESEPIVRLLQENAYRELLLRQRINEAARATMLAYAEDADLDQLGANLKVTRLVIDAGDATAVPPVPATKEEDDDFRARILLSLDAYSTAGSREAYRFHALSADGDVLDADPVSPTPGHVVVYVLSRTGNGEASDALLATVTTALSDETVRPMSDSLLVQSATILEYSVAATLYIQTGPDASTVRELALQAAQAYADTTHRMRTTVSLAGLYAALKQEGVVDMELASPVATIRPDAGQAAWCTGIVITVELASNG